MTLIPERTTDGYGANTQYLHGLRTYVPLGHLSVRELDGIQLYLQASPHAQQLDQEQINREHQIRFNRVAEQLLQQTSQ